MTAHRTEIESSSNGVYATCSCGWKQYARTFVLAAEYIVKHAKEAALVEKEMEKP